MIESLAVKWRSILEKITWERKQLELYTIKTNSPERHKMHVAVENVIKEFLKDLEPNVRAKKSKEK